MSRTDQHVHTGLQRAALHFGLCARHLARDLGSAGAHAVGATATSTT